MKRPSLSAYHILHNQRGFTLFEIFLTLLILAIAIIPMMNAFAPALLSSGQGEEQAVLTSKARQTMNGLLDLDFRTLDENKATPGVLITKLGDQAAAGVVITVADVSGGAGGLLELTVTLKTVKLQTLKAAR
jgi:Tfp pilus assembly protein PilE